MIVVGYPILLNAEILASIKFLFDGGGHHELRNPGIGRQCNMTAEEQSLLRKTVWIQKSIVESRRIDMDKATTKVA